jgi:hypothetical protein
LSRPVEEAVAATPGSDALEPQGAGAPEHCHAIAAVHVLAQPDAVVGLVTVGLSDGHRCNAVPPCGGFSKIVCE